jgi:hypothetical protein
LKFLITAYLKERRGYDKEFKAGGWNGRGYGFDFFSFFL